MNHSESDEPILTAYALGELDATERASVEARLKTDAAARQFVEETRAFASELGAALHAKPAADLTPEQKAEILAESGRGKPARSKMIPFPLWFVPLATAAAILLVMSWIFIKPPEQPRTPTGSEMTISTATEPPVDALAQANEQGWKKLALKQDPLSAAAKSEVTGGYIAKQLAADASDLKDRLLTPTASSSASMPVTVLAPRVVAANDASAEMSAPSIRQETASPIIKFTAGWSTDASGSNRDDVTVVGSAIPGLRQREAGNTEAYDRISDNEFLAVRDQPLSTFSIDVDTASYSNLRRFIEGGSLPPKDAVRIEELINYFQYEYPQPKGDDPFSVKVEVAPAPWNPKHLLAKIGLKGREIAPDKRPPLNLVFLLDVSGSMDEPNKLPLVRQSMKMLVARLNLRDRVAIVVYAGASGMALPSTEASHKKEIVTAIDTLKAGGSTNGAAGIQLAYDIAKANFIKDGVNRVILCTDGDFNVGVTNQGDLLRLIEQKAKSGTFLTVLGFGMGNYKDSTLEKLADTGNGNYGYVDTEREAKKLLVDQLSGTLVTIAKDVKIQVEFNPAQVGAYRLIGYENRLLKAEDFNDDQKDAGEIGAGHTVTALYELTPLGDNGGGSSVDPLKYQQPVKEQDKSTPAPATDELMSVKVRYKQPDGEVSSKIELAVMPPSLKDGATAMSKDFQFAAAIAEFGMLLRESPFKGDATWKSAADLAENGLGQDARGDRHEFLRLLQRAQKLAEPDSISKADQ